MTLRLPLALAPALVPLAALAAAPAADAQSYYVQRAAGQSGCSSCAAGRAVTPAAYSQPVVSRQSYAQPTYAPQRFVTGAAAPVVTYRQPTTTAYRQTYRQPATTCRQPSGVVLTSGTAAGGVVRGGYQTPSAVGGSDQARAQAEANQMARTGTRGHVGGTIGRFEGVGWASGGTPNTCRAPAGMRLTADAIARGPGGVYRVRAWR